MEHKKLQFIINLLTPKKMSKQVDLEAANEQLAKDKKALVKALQTSQDYLIVLKKQLNFNEEHNITALINKNEKTLNSFQ